MPRSLVDQVADKNNLREAWRRIRSNVPGKKRHKLDNLGYSVNSIDSNIESELSAIHSSLIGNDGYKFRDLVAHPIPKKSGHRIICVPPLVDRLVQRAVLEFLSKGDRFRILNPISFGYVSDPERTVRMAAGNALKYRATHPWVYKTDISKFFDRIPRELLIARLETLCRSTPLLKLLARAVNCEIAKTNPRDTQLIHEAGIRKGQGVRQGMPLSPLFANVILGPFDRTMLRKKFNVVRYADDLIAMADSEAECMRIHDTCRLELGKLGLTVPDLNTPNSKSIISAPDEAAEFLGVSLERAPGATGYVLQVPTETMQKMQDKIANYGNLSFLTSQGITIGNLGKVLGDITDGWKSAYSHCNNARLLRNSLDRWRSKALETLFRKHFNLDLGTMSESQKNFLLWNSLTE